MAFSDTQDQTSPAGRGLDERPPTGSPVILGVPEVETRGSDLFWLVCSSLLGIDVLRQQLFLPGVPVTGDSEYTEGFVNTI